MLDQPPMINFSGMGVIDVSIISQTYWFIVVNLAKYLEQELRVTCLNYSMKYCDI